MSTPTPENRAAYLTHKQAHPFTISPAPMPTPKPTEVLIRVAAVSINPADFGVQAMGIIVDQFPAILGSDAAGTITAVGSSITKFKVGDRVTALTEGLVPGALNMSKAAFQLYTVADEVFVAKVPDAVAFKEGCILPLCLATAATALYQPDNLALPLPKVGAKEEKGEVLVIWGAASAVGSCAIQMAKASGYEIAATASPHNFEYAKSIGADHVFDYKKDSVVEDVVSALKGKKCAGVFAATVGWDLFGKALQQCGQITSQLGGRKLLGSVIPPGMPLPDTLELPEDITFLRNWGTAIKNTHVGPYLFNEWIPAALADGSLKCKPDVEVVGKGLESCQEAVDRVGKGVSAKKLVVEF